MHATESNPRPKPKCIPSIGQAYDPILCDHQMWRDGQTFDCIHRWAEVRLQISRSINGMFNPPPPESIHFQGNLLNCAFISFPQITVSTMDRRKLQLVFKINIIEMDSNILVDFRLSKGDGIEFKKSFVKVKNALSDIIGKELTSWWWLYGRRLEPFEFYFLHLQLSVVHILCCIPSILARNSSFYVSFCLEYFQVSLLNGKKLWPIKWIWQKCIAFLFECRRWTWISKKS